MAQPLTIDVSSAQALINKMRNLMTPQKFHSAMYGIFKREASHIKVILGKDLPTQYHVTSTDVRKTVGAPQVKANNAGAGCIVPVSDKRRHIGSSFKAQGSMPGFQAMVSGHYNITANILKSRTSTLPYTMKKAGQAPFRNIPSKLNQITYYREGQSRLPIRTVVGTSIPQMPLNLSNKDVQNDIATHFQSRVAHRLQAFILTGK